MPQLPHEIRVQIIKLLPEVDWFKVVGIEFLECGLHDKRLWKEINAEHFGDLNQNIHLFKACGYLTETLHMQTNCWDSELSTLKDLLSSFTNLRHVDLSGNSELKTITFLCETQDLETLNLHQCSKILRLPLIGSILSFQNLQGLDVSECDQLKEKDILRIAKQLKQLKYFNTRDTQSLTGSTVTEVKSHLICLQQFLFCPLVNPNATEEWVSIYMQHPILQICPAGLEIILEKNPHLL